MIEYMDKFSSFIGQGNAYLVELTTNMSVIYWEKIDENLVGMMVVMLSLILPWFLGANKLDG